MKPLMFAAIENNMSLMERLVALGCSVNKKNKEGYIALHFGNTEHILNPPDILFRGQL